MGRFARRWNERMLRYITKDGPERIDEGTLVYRASQRSPRYAAYCAARMWTLAEERWQAGRRENAIELLGLAIRYCRPWGAQCEFGLGASLVLYADYRTGVGQGALDEAREGHLLLERHKADHPAVYAMALDVLTKALGAEQHHEEAADTARRAVEARRETRADDGKLLAALERAAFWLEKAGYLAELPAIQDEIGELRRRGA